MLGPRRRRSRTHSRRPACPMRLLPGGRFYGPKLVFHLTARSDAPGNAGPSISPVHAGRLGAAMSGRTARSGPRAPSCVLGRSSASRIMIENYAGAFASAPTTRWSRRRVDADAIHASRGVPEGGGAQVENDLRMRRSTTSGEHSLARFPICRARQARGRSGRCGAAARHRRAPEVLSLARCRAPQGRGVPPTARLMAGSSRPASRSAASGRPGG